MITRANIMCVPKKKQEAALSHFQFFVTSKLVMLEELVFVLLDIGLYCR